MLFRRNSVGSVGKFPLQIRALPHFPHSQFILSSFSLLQFQKKKIMISGNYYRSWMDKTHLDPNTNLLTEEYTEGVGEFMRLVQQQPEANNGMLRCLCSSCNNNRIIKE